MKVKAVQISLFSITLIFLFLSGCFSPPDLDIEPRITFKSLVFKNVSTGSDSLILRFQIQDGDGDIGLLSDETFFPYHPYNIVIDSRDSVVKFRDPSVIPPFRTIDPRNNVTSFSEGDNRPPYNCQDYDIASFSDLNINNDTIFISRNEYHNNIHVTFLKKDLASGTFSEIDFAKEFGNACAAVSIDGRIPIFDTGLLGKPLQGIFSYYMVSEGFILILTNQTFKIRFYIYDRALNQSNIIDTPEYTIQDITK